MVFTHPRGARRRTGAIGGALALAVGLSTLGAVSGTPEAAAAPPPAVVVASGTPATAAAGTLWGTPAVGGAYTYPNGTGGTTATGSGVGDKGLLQTYKGMTASAHLPAVSQRDVSIDTTFAVEQLPTIGTGVRYSLAARLVGKQYYRASVQIAPSGAGTLALARADDAAGTLVGTVYYDLPSALVTGQKYRMQFEVVGEQTPTLRMRLFADGSSAPGWQLQMTDTTPGQLTGAGAIGFLSYTSGGSDFAKLRLHAFEAKSVPPANVPPVASFTASAPNLVASFDATASKDTDGAVTAYAWDFGDGTTGTGAKATHAYTKAGTYTVALTVTDDSGAETTTTRTVSPSWPGAHNTGVPDGTVLKTYTGTKYLEQANLVLDGYDFGRLSLVIKAKNVTIRNSIIRGDSQNTLVQVSAGSNVIIEDSTIVASNPTLASSAFYPGNYTLRRVEVTNVIDGALVTEGNVVIEDSWFHDNAVLPQASQPDGVSHSDSVQIENGSNMVFQRNRMESPYTSVFMFSQNQVKDGPAVSNIRIEGNYLDGGACTVNFKNAASAPRPAPTGVTIADNTFGRGQQYANCGVRITAGWPLDLRNNFFVDGVAVGRTHFVDP